MSRIVTNVQSLIAQRVLGAQNKALNESLTRLSTGLRINTGKDDPAGLIGSESLRSEKVAISAAIENARRADNVLAIAEGALQEVNRLLLDLEGLVDRSANEAGLSAAEVTANQVQIDAILSSINRVANTASFNGSKLLGGGFEFTTSGIAASAVTATQVNSAKIPEGASRQVVIDVVTASQFASISGAGGGTAGVLSAVTTLEVGGTFGTETFSFASGTTLSSIATAINTSTQLTGVSAVVSSGDIFFTSTAYGAAATVSVEVLGGDPLSLSANNDAGVDGTITINGTTANVNGLEASVNTGSLSVELSLDAAFASTSGSNSSFEITGGGARFAIAPELSLVGIETIGIQSVSTGSLGNGVTGFLTTLASGSANDLQSKNFASAQRVVRAAQQQVSTLRGRIGGFQKNTLGTAINSLLITLENTAAAESAIRETDFAEATSALTRAQILVNSATSTLQLSNAQPQSVLALLQ
ncbi:MAG: flagellin [Planctomycetes bacterium]|nr:flagellin [Planctomycetota bacterium]